MRELTCFFDRPAGEPCKGAVEEGQEAAGGEDGGEAAPVLKKIGDFFFNNLWEIMSHAFLLGSTPVGLWALVWRITFVSAKKTEIVTVCFSIFFMATDQRPLLRPLQVLHHPLQVKRANLSAAAERQVAVGAGFYF